MTTAITRSKDSFDDDGMFNNMMMLVMLYSISMLTTSLIPIAAQAVAMSFEGAADPRVIEASSELKWLDLIHNAPRKPWSWALFRNSGPNEVEVSINDPNKGFIVYPNRPVTVDRRGAEIKMSLIFFICKPTETATINVDGEY